MTASLAVTATLARLLVGYGSRKRGPIASVSERRIPGTWGPHPSILYEPNTAPRGTLVLVHGVTARASDDPSLVHLARCLASLGYRCLTPSLPGLARFRHCPGDVELVVGAIREASKLAGAGVGIMGFSYGASYALCAIADAQCRHRCRHMVGFGAYYLLQEALEHQRQLLIANPDPARDSADLAYLRYTLLVSQRDELALPQQVWDAIDSVMETFTSEGPIATKLRPLLTHARHIDYVDLMERYKQRDLPPRLSPAGVLGGVRCSVGLLHDPGDRFVPPTHVERIREELAQHPSGPPVYTLTTAMLSHVQVAPLRKVVDLPRLLQVVGPLLAEH